MVPLLQDLGRPSVAHNDEKSISSPVAAATMHPTNTMKALLPILALASAPQPTRAEFRRFDGEINAACKCQMCRDFLLGHLRIFLIVHPTHNFYTVMFISINTIYMLSLFLISKLHSL